MQRTDIFCLTLFANHSSTLLVQLKKLNMTGESLEACICYGVCGAADVNYSRLIRGHYSCLVTDYSFNSYVLLLCFVYYFNLLFRFLVFAHFIYSST